MNVRRLTVVVSLVCLTMMALVPWPGTPVAVADTVKLPIVFVHGWLGLEFSGCTRPVDYEDTYFQSVDEDLQQAGYPVYYARLETSFCYTPRLRDNVPNLTAAINQAKNETQQSQVILIAHSMGGLVSRAYIEGPSYAGDVKALYTFGSPHLGTPIVDLLAFAGNGGPAGVYCLFQRAACEFSVLGMHFFNQYYRQRADVEYHTIGGNAPFLERTAFGMVTDILIPGPDDGIVPTSSGTAVDLGTRDRFETAEVHGPSGDGVFGTRTYFVRDGGPSQSYVECLKKVLVDQTSDICGTITAQGTGPRVLAAAANGQEQGKAAVPAEAQRVPFSYGSLGSGRLARRLIVVEGGPAVFAAHWQAGTLTTALLDPRGKRIDAQYAASHPDEVIFKTDGRTAVYYMPNAPAGAWQLELSGTNVPAKGSEYTTFAAFGSSLKLTGELNSQTYQPGTKATIMARLTGNPTKAHVTATILHPDGLQETVRLLPRGQGIYQAVYRVPNSPGYVEVRLKAQGLTANSTSFERGQTLLFLIENK